MMNCVYLSANISRSLNGFADLYTHYQPILQNKSHQTQIEIWYSRQTLLLFYVMIVQRENRTIHWFLLSKNGKGETRKLQIFLN